MNEAVYDVQKIFQLLPHRYPFLLIDRVVSITDPPGDTRVGRKTVGIKNVTINEPFFNGHFPGLPIMPGVLQVEAMAQLAALSFYRPGDEPMDFLIASIKEARFRKPVVPGDVLEITCDIVKDRGTMMQVETKCRVDGDVVAEATILAFVSPQSKRAKK